MSIVSIDDVSLNLEVSLYGEIQEVSPTISKCRCRIFYKGLNRNRTFISEEFAQQLINSLPYVPIKGIFSYADGDYTDHGADNDEGKIYGIVPEKPNFRWEKHLDKDGIERDYVCCDVYLFTALYPEASCINGKSQSMEIYKDTVKGEWRIWEEDGKPYFHFLSGQLLGLQVLGDNVEPCFEGSAFFSLIKDTQEIMNYIKLIKKEEREDMDKDTNLFRLSDNEKHDLLWNSLNPNYTEAGGWSVDYMVCDIYDDYAICRTKENKYCRVYYSKADDKVTIGEIVDTFIVDVTKAEYDALEIMKAMGDGNFEKSEQNYTAKISTLEAEKAAFETKASELEAANTEFSARITELETGKTEFEQQVSELENSKTEFERQIAELETGRETYEKQISELDAEKIRLNSQIDDMNNERQILVEFKANIEKGQKEEVLNDFAGVLPQETIENFTAKIGDYSVEDFKKEISFAAYQTNPAIFTKEPSNGYIYKNNGDGEKVESSLISILKKHKGGK